jgi:hypothetical protein
MALFGSRSPSAPNLLRPTPRSGSTHSRMVTPSGGPSAAAGSPFFGEGGTASPSSTTDASSSSSSSPKHSGGSPSAAESALSTLLTSSTGLGASATGASSPFLPLAGGLPPFLPLSAPADAAASASSARLAAAASATASRSALARAGVQASTRISTCSENDVSVRWSWSSQTSSILRWLLPVPPSTSSDVGPVATHACPARGGGITAVSAASSRHRFSPRWKA